MNRSALKRAALGVVVVAVLASVVAAVLFYRAGGEGQTQLERWIGSQLRLVVNSYLNPQLEFESIDYQYPRTVVLTGVRLVADDPSAAWEVAGSVDVIRADRLRIELAAIPQVGQPVVIQSIDADRPVLRLVSYERDKGPELVGLTDLVKSGDASRQEGAPPTLSDVFQMKSVTLRNATLMYDTREQGQPPMVLDGFSTELTFDRDDKGWYAFELELGREPVLSLDSSGRLDLDGFQIELNETTLELELGSEEVSALPPQVQGVLREHDVKGRLSVTLSGLVPLMDWQAMRVDAALKVDDANIAFGDYRLPVEKLSLRAAVEGGRAQIDPVDVRLLDGELSGVVGVALDEAFNTRAVLQWSGLSLRQAVRGGRAASETSMAGKINGEVTLDAPLAAATTQVGGQGQVHVRDGRFASMPVLSKITGALRQAAKAVALSGGESSDTADINFELRGDHAYLTTIDLSTAAVVFVGKGSVGFDERLDLSLTGGPIKKVQQKLGLLGKVLGEMTEVVNITRYEVRGTLDNPTVTIAIAGAPERSPDAANPRGTSASELFEDLRGKKKRDEEEEDEDDPFARPEDEKKDRFGF